MENWLGANWKTTLIGGVKQVISAFVLGTLTFPSDWSSGEQIARFILTIVAGVLGVSFANQVKDKSVTGGTVQQTADNKVAPESAASASVTDTKQATEDRYKSVFP